ncbi:MAG: glycoside hydrolase family 5 protein [Fibrobacterales bacterium]
MYNRCILRAGLLLLILSTLVTAGPVSYYGQMEANGTRIYGAKTGLAMQVRGVSLFHSNDAPQYWTRDIVHRLIDDWKIEVIRAAFMTSDWPDKKWMVEEIINAAIEKDVYVIVDYHAYDPQGDKAAWFFGDLAKQYGDNDHVIWEVYNEPLDKYNWQESIKPHVEQAVAAIREHSDNLILAGTRIWSQRTDEAAASPVDDDNIAYVMHFYVGSHASWVKNYSETAMGKPGDGDAVTIQKRVPIFASEWGYWPPGSDGHFPSAEKFSQSGYENCSGGHCSNIDMSGYDWLNFMAQNQINWACWSVNNKAEGSSMFHNVPDNPTEWGHLILNHIKQWTENQSPWRFAVEVGPLQETLAQTKLIDDLDDIGSRNFWKGEWKTSSDAADGGASTITPVADAVAGTDLSVDLSFVSSIMWQHEPYGHVSLSLNDAGTAISLEGCTKVQYDYTGMAHTFQVATTGVEARNAHQTEVASSEEWATVVVDWSLLKQPGWVLEPLAIDKQGVTGFVWKMRGADGTTGRLSIDNIACLDVTAPQDRDYTAEVAEISSSEVVVTSSSQKSTFSSADHYSGQVSSSSLINDYPPGSEVTDFTYVRSNASKSLSLVHLNGSGSFAITIPQSQTYTVLLYSVSGVEVAQVHGQHFSEGTQEVVLAQSIPKGIYVVKLVH